MGRLSAGCDSLERLSLGAYVLGALDPVERARFEEHLASCDSCREELVQMAGLPGLLSRVSLEEALDPPSAAPSPVRPRRFAAIGSVAAIAAVAAALILALVTGGKSGSPSEPQTVAAANQRTGVSATMALRPARWGTEVKVRLAGVPAGTRCRLVAIGRDGSRDIAGTWRADYEGRADVRAATAIPSSDLAYLDVVAGGQRLVRAAL
jgi:anti-sigma factor RsiW